MLESGVRTCRETSMAEDQDPAKKTPPPFHIDSLLGRAPSPNHFSSDGRIDENCSQSLACTTAALPLSVYAQAAPPPSRIQPNAPASTDQGKLKSECCSINLQFPYLTHMRASVKQRVRRLHYMKCAHCKGRTSLYACTRPGDVYWLVAIV